MTDEEVLRYEKLEQLEHILLRPNIYIGECRKNKEDVWVLSPDKRMEKRRLTFSNGFLKIFDEILVNAIDASVQYKVSIISVDINENQVSVYNDGVNIPIKIHPKYGIYVPELIFFNLMSGSNFSQESKVVGGQNGLGSTLTNIFSTKFIIEIVNDGIRYIQTAENNMRVIYPPEISKVSKTTKNYIKIIFTPDFKRFEMEDIDPDTYILLEKRVYDVVACTNKKVKVYLNEELLNLTTFKDYTSLFPLDFIIHQPLEVEVNGNTFYWDLAVGINDTYECVSFVNGICVQEGTHINYILKGMSKKLCSIIETKHKIKVKPSLIKDHLFIILRTTIINPSFKSQTKEELTTPSKLFGVQFEVNDNFIQKLYNTKLTDLILSINKLKFKKELIKSDGKKVNKLHLPKLEDAIYAGTKRSKDCTLILCEGDSALASVIAGISVVGRDYWGTFALKGVSLNVKDASIEKITENGEIKNIKKILGLQQKDYKNTEELRYGRIMLMTDADYDAFHIKGLIFNLFESLFPSLFKMDGFFISMLTPIIKASNGKEEIPFYTTNSFEERNKIKKGNYKIKYYEGLGTSTEKEAIGYFKTMKTLKYVYDEYTDEYMDLAFNKKRSDDRKLWLMTYDKNDVLDYNKNEVSYTDFINKELIHFSNKDLERSISHIMDGLKPSTRKILFACFKRNLKEELKVAQLAAYVAEVSAYHHGEVSLQNAIINLAQNFVGKNNLNLLLPLGQFGTRLGSAPASPRYIFTKLAPYTKFIFRKEDEEVLNWVVDDGIQVEPEYYTPIIPMILVNGSIGIGTGFSTQVPQYNVKDVIASCERIIEAKGKLEELKFDLEPYYNGFKGEIISKGKNWESIGIYKWVNDETIEITELPIGV